MGSTARAGRQLKGLKGGRNGESSANSKGLTFSLSCCYQSGPLWWSHRQNLLRFLSLDERRASCQGEEKERERANPGRSTANRSGRVQTFDWTLGEDFEQSQSNHGWPRVAFATRFGHFSWIFPKIQYQGQISAPVFQNFLDTTSRAVGTPRRRDGLAPLGATTSSTHPESREGRYPDVLPHSGSRAKPMDRPNSHSFHPSYRPH